MGKEGRALGMRSDLQMLGKQGFLTQAPGSAAQPYCTLRMYSSKLT